MLSCRDISKLATAYDEGALGFFARLSFRAHLMMCDHCRRYVRQLRLTVAALKRGAGEAAAPADETRAALAEAFRARKKGSTEPPA